VQWRAVSPATFVASRDFERKLSDVLRHRPSLAYTLRRQRLTGP
jgi:hypothetical protein